MAEFDIRFADSEDDDDLYDGVSVGAAWPPDDFPVTHAARRIDAPTPELAVARFMALRAGDVELSDFIGRLDFDGIDKRYWTMVWAEHRDTREPRVFPCGHGPTTWRLPAEGEDAGFDILLNNEGEIDPIVGRGIKAASEEVALAIWMADALGESDLAQRLAALDLKEVERRYVAALNEHGWDGRRLVAEPRDPGARPIPRASTTK